MDVNNVFLHGHLMEAMHMIQLPGFVDKNNPTHYPQPQECVSWFEISLSGLVP